MELEIKPEQINKLVADAVLQSAIGEQLNKIVQEHVAKLSSSWDNPIDKVVAQEIRQLVASVLMTEHHDALRAKVSAAVAAKLTDDFVGKIIEHGLADRHDR